MTIEYQYELEKSSKKFCCPECSKNAFVRYIDTETGDYLPEQYGRCDRESKCAYHLHPFLEGYVKIKQKQGQTSGNWKPRSRILQLKKGETAETIFIPLDVLKQTLQQERYEQNVFIQNLLSRVAFPFDVEEIEKAITHYYLGTITSGYRKGAITFPFIDKNYNVRAIQVKEFDETSHTISTDFLHSIIEKHNIRNNKQLPLWLEAYLKQDKRVTCLFGEHLLSKYPQNPVALVEAPKTAVYGSLYFGFPEQPENLIWLAVYNKSSFSFDKLKAMRGRDVFIFPDLSKNGIAFAEWQTKAKDFENRLPGTRFIFSDLLEQFATDEDKNNGNDLADYLIQHDWRKFRKQKFQEQSETFSIKTSNRENCEKCESQTKTFFSQTDQPSFEELSEQKKLGDLFNYYYKKGYKSIPAGIQINADNWKSQTPIDNYKRQII